MKPDKAGVWEWFEEDGTKRCVSVYDVGIGKPHLRVAWWGGYYDVHDSQEELFSVDGHLIDTIDRNAEWPDRWGRYVGPNGSVSESFLYQQPTIQQRMAILGKRK